MLQSPTPPAMTGADLIACSDASIIAERAGIGIVVYRDRIAERSAIVEACIPLTGRWANSVMLERLALQTAWETVLAATVAPTSVTMVTDCLQLLQIRLDPAPDIPFTIRRDRTSLGMARAHCLARRAAGQSANCPDAALDLSRLAGPVIRRPMRPVRR